MAKKISLQQAIETSWDIIKKQEGFPLLNVYSMSKTGSWSIRSYDLRRVWNEQAGAYCNILWSSHTYRRLKKLGEEQEGHVAITVSMEQPEDKTGLEQSVLNAIQAKSFLADLERFKPEGVI